MNSVIEAQIEYFDQIHPISFVCGNEFSSDAGAIDLKLKMEFEPVNCGGSRCPGVSKSANIYKRSRIHQLPNESC